MAARQTAVGMALWLLLVVDLVPGKTGCFTLSPVLPPRLPCGRGGAGMSPGLRGPGGWQWEGGKGWGSMCSVLGGWTLRRAGQSVGFGAVQRDGEVGVGEEVDAADGLLYRWVYSAHGPRVRATLSANEHPRHLAGLVRSGARMPAPGTLRFTEYPPLRVSTWMSPHSPTRPPTAAEMGASTIWTS